MKPSFGSILRLAACAACAATVQAGDPVSGKDVVDSTPLSTPWGGPVLGGGVKTNDAFTEGSLFMVYPLLDSIGEGNSMEGTLFYLEPYGTWAESGELGTSLGLGFRHLFSDQSVSDALANTNPGLFGEGVFVGGNLFLDYSHTSRGSDFWQGGIGAEVGTRYLEFRANYYVPFSDDRTIARFTDTDVSHHTTSSSRTVLGAPSVRGGQIVQSVARQTTTKTTTTTTRTNYELFEEPLEGWDLEMALLVPGLDQYCDLRLVGGYYEFSGDRSPDGIEGWRMGAELRPIPALVLHGTWYESERLYEDNWLAGVRVELPLEGIRDSLRMRRRHLAERLFEPVRRKNSAVTSSGVQSATTSTSTSTTTSQSTTTTSQGTQAIGNVEKKEDDPKKEK